MGRRDAAAARALLPWTDALDQLGIERVLGAVVRPAADNAGVEQAGEAVLLGRLVNREVVGMIVALEWQNDLQTAKAARGRLVNLRRAFVVEVDARQAMNNSGSRSIARVTRSL